MPWWVFDEEMGLRSDDPWWWVDLVFELDLSDSWLGRWFGGRHNCLYISEDWYLSRGDWWVMLDGWTL